MRRICWTCEHFGKCNIDVRVCKDWGAYGGRSFTFDIQSFSAAWERRHRRWYERKYYKGLVDQRMHALDLYLNGRNEADVVDNALQTMKDKAEEPLYAET